MAQLARLAIPLDCVLRSDTSLLWSAAYRFPKSIAGLSLQALLACSLSCKHRQRTCTTWLYVEQQP